MNNMNNQKKARAAAVSLPLAGAGSAGGQAFGGLHAAAVERIGGWIVQGRIAPGDILSNEQIAALGLSRSVLREAIKVLAGKGKGLKEIAKALGRTEESTKERAKIDGVGIAKKR